MKKIIFLLSVFVLLLRPGYVSAQNQSYQGFCSVGGVKVMTSGLSSSTTVQASYPQCTVTVYLTGTSTLANIFADGSGTPLANPFTANNNASWLFYANNTGYDAVLSGGVPNQFPAPFTLINVPAGGGGSGTINPATVRRPITFYPNVGSIVSPSGGAFDDGSGNQSSNSLNSSLGGGNNPTVPVTRGIGDGLKITANATSGSSSFTLASGGPLVNSPVNIVNGQNIGGDVGKLVRLGFNGQEIDTTITVVNSSSTFTAATPWIFATEEVFMNYGTDNYTAIQNALNAAGTNGSTVDLPCGVYAISQGLTLPHIGALRGFMPHASCAEIAYMGSTTIKAAVAGPVSGGNLTKVSDLAITGNFNTSFSLYDQPDASLYSYLILTESNTTTGACMQLQGGAEYTIDNVRCNTAGASGSGTGVISQQPNGIQINGAGPGKIQGVVLENLSGVCLDFLTGGGNMYDGQISSCGVNWQEETGTGATSNFGTLLEQNGSQTNGFCNIKGGSAKFYATGCNNLMHVFSTATGFSIQDTIVGPMQIDAGATSPTMINIRVDPSVIVATEPSLLLLNISEASTGGAPARNFPINRIPTYLGGGSQRVDIDYSFQPFGVCATFNTSGCVMYPIDVVPFSSAGQNWYAKFEGFNTFGAAVTFEFTPSRNTVSIGSGNTITVVENTSTSGSCFQGASACPLNQLDIYTNSGQPLMSGHWTIIPNAPSDVSMNLFKVNFANLSLSGSSFLTGIQGAGANISTSTGAFVSGHLRGTDSNGTEIDVNVPANSLCVLGGSTGCGINTYSASGLGLAYYSTSGVLSGDSHFTTDAAGNALLSSSTATIFNQSGAVNASIEHCMQAGGMLRWCAGMDSAEGDKYSISNREGSVRYIFSIDSAAPDSSLTIDSSGNLHPLGGVSVSGSSCTITAITNGIVTAATCP